MAHADVVPVGKGWEHNPFVVTEKDGVLTGRGVADDKGPLLETYYAIKALKDNNLLGNYQIRFLVGGNEEIESLGMKHYFEVLKKEQPTLGFSPDSSWPLIYAEKGIRTFEVNATLHLDNIHSIYGGSAANAVIDECIINLKGMDHNLVNLFMKEVPNTQVLCPPDGHIEIIVKGKAAHGSIPQEGINAGMITLQTLNKYYQNETLSRIVDLYSDVYAHGIDAYFEGNIMEDTNTSLNVGVLHFDNDVCKLTVNYRYPDTCDINKTWVVIKEKNKGFTLKILADSPLLCFSKDSDLVKILLDSYQQETGDYQSKPIASGGGTYAKEADNVVAFGAEFPNWDSKMHGVGEGCRKVDMFKSMAIYARAIHQLGKKLEE